MHDTRRTRLVLAVLLIAALALITVSARNSAAGPVRGLRAFGGLLFGSAESVASGVTQPVAAFLGNVGSAAHSQATIGALQREVVQLRGQLSQARLSKADEARRWPACPKGASRLWSAPALKPSSETEKL